MTQTLQNATQSYRCTPLIPATILLVEDEAAVREVTREALEMGGFRVLAADGPALAICIAADRSNAIDLLLTDVVMPGINGVELARQIHTLRPGLATLFMTGYADSEVLRQAKLNNRQQHIKKPFTIHSLLGGVADALAARWNGGDRKRVPQHPST